MKDIIESLKIRFSNPFLISFLISWPFWNWEISVCFLRYNAETLKEYTGCNNFIEVILHYSNWSNSFWKPLFSALGYIIFAPAIKYLISIYTTYITTREDSQILEISGTATIPTKKYLDTVKESNDYIKELSDIIKKDEAYMQENSKLTTLNVQLTNDLQIEKNNHEKTENSLALLQTQYESAQEEVKELKKSAYDVGNERYKYSEDLAILQGTHNKMLFRSSSDFLKGDWMGKLSTPWDNVGYNFSFSIINNQVRNFKSDPNLGLVFIEVKNYFLNVSTQQAMLSFVVHYLNPKFSKLSDDIKLKNNRLMDELDGKIFIGKLLEDENTFELYSESDVYLTLIKSA